MLCFCRAVTTNRRTSGIQTFASKIGGKVSEIIFGRLNAYTSPPKRDPYLERVSFLASKYARDPERVRRITETYPIATEAGRNMNGRFVGSVAMFSRPPPQIIVVPNHMYGFHNGIER